MEKTVETGHPALEQLPHWPTRTIAILSTLDQAPYAIPISAPLRADDHRILFSLHPHDTLIWGTQ